MDAILRKFRNRLEWNENPGKSPRFSLWNGLPESGIFKMIQIVKNITNKY